MRVADAKSWLYGHTLAAFLVLGPSVQGLASDWERMSTTDAPRYSMAWLTGNSEFLSVVIDDQLTVIGKESATRTNVFPAGRYDFSTNTWANMPSASVAGIGDYHFNYGQVFNGRAFYVWGGCDAQNCRSLTNLGWMVDPNTNTWTAMPTEGAPTPRHKVKLVAIGEKLLVWFGSLHHDTQTSPDVGIFDPATRSWSQLSLTGGPSPRQGSAVWYKEGRLFVAGGISYDGRGDAQYHNDFYTYDFDTSTWSRLADFPVVARYDAVVVDMGSKVLVWGGKVHVRPGYYDLVSDGMIFDGASWTYLPKSELSGGPAPRAEMHGLFLSGKAVLWGGVTQGNNSGTFEDTGFTLHPETLSWESLPPAPIGLAAVVTSVNDDLILWGDRFTRGDSRVGYVLGINPD